MKKIDIRTIFEKGRWINRYEKILNITDYLVYRNKELSTDDEIKNQIKNVFVQLLGSDFESEYFVVKEQWTLEKAFNMSEFFNDNYIRKYKQLRKNIKDIFKNYTKGSLNKRNKLLHHTIIRFISQHKRELKTLYDTLNQERFLKQIGKKAFVNAFNNYIKKVDEMLNIVKNFVEKINWAGQRWQEFSIRKRNLNELKKEMNELDKINNKKFLERFFEMLNDLIKLQEHFIYLSKNVTITKKHRIYYVSDTLELIKIYDKDGVEFIYVPEAKVKEQLLSA